MSVAVPVICCDFIAASLISDLFVSLVSQHTNFTLDVGAMNLLRHLTLTYHEASPSLNHCVEPKK